MFRGNNNRGLHTIRYKRKLDLMDIEEAERIHLASLEILKRVGVKMPNRKAQEVLAGAGAKVDLARNQVFFPSEIVDEALKRAPSGFVLCAREKEKDLPVYGEEGYLTLDGSGLQVLDLSDGHLRRSTLRDLEEATLVADYLDQVSFLWPVVSAQDCPANKQALYELAAQLTWSSKHVQAMTAVNGETARGSVELAAAIAGGSEALRERPIISNFQCSISPLAYDPEGLDAVMVFADAGIPTGFLTMQVGCSTAPATLAGSLAQANAEVLAGIVFLQNYKPGSPTFYGSCATVMELRSGAVASGGPEDFVLQALSAQMARFYNLPSNIGTFATGAKQSNWHAGVENSVSGMISTLAGADMMCGAGLLAGAVIFSFEQLLLDCEIFEIIRQSVQGIRVDEETLALDTIERVGSEDHFMVEPHTLKHMRSLWQPSVINRDPYGKWQDGGCREVQENARDKAKWILANHKPLPLEKGLEDEFDTIIKHF